MSSDDILAKAEAALQRHGGTPRLIERAAKRKRADMRARIGRIALLGGAIAIGLPAWGLIVGPVGTTGLMLAVLGFLVGGAALTIFPKGSALPGEVVPTTELALLPLRTEEWLARQRPALPAPAARLIDGIGMRLETLAPQLQRLDEREPAAASVRRLIADELPELVNGYARVPKHLRADGLNGLSPDKQLLDGLAVVDSELARMSEQIATGDLNQLATQKRYLEIKYQGDDTAD
jgi:hypothetical protein